MKKKDKKNNGKAKKTNLENIKMCAFWALNDLCLINSFKEEE